MGKSRSRALIPGLWSTSCTPNCVRSSLRRKRRTDRYLPFYHLLQAVLSRRASHNTVRLKDPDCVRRPQSLDEQPPLTSPF